LLQPLPPDRTDPRCLGGGVVALKWQGAVLLRLAAAVLRAAAIALRSGSCAGPSLLVSLINFGVVSRFFSLDLCGVSPGSTFNFDLDFILLYTWNIDLDFNLRLAHPSPAGIKFPLIGHASLIPLLLDLRDFL